MPTVLRIGPYRFYFYAGDRNEPEYITSNETIASPGFSCIP